MGKTVACQNCGKEYVVAWRKWMNETLCPECFKQEFDSLKTPATATTSDDYFIKGQKLFRSLDRKAALKNFDAAIKLDPNNSSAYYLRGLSFFRLGNKERTLKDIKFSANLGYEKAQNLLKSVGINYQQ